MILQNIIKNWKTSLGAAMALIGVALCFYKNEYGIPLIGLAGGWVGLNSKDDNK